MSVTSKQAETNSQDTPYPDPHELGHALLDAYEKAQPLIQDYMQKYGDSDAVHKEFADFNFDPMNVRDAYMTFVEKITENPEKFFEIQANYMQDWMSLWQGSMNKFMGESAEPVITPAAGDRRFKSPEWEENTLFDFIKQSYLLTCRHVETVIDDVDGLSATEREKLRFQSKLLTDAMSPTNFALTNPDVIRETIDSRGENLVKGLDNLMKDLQRGKGQLAISTTNYDAFKLGENIAVTDGRVVYENDLMQLIQYAPTTKTVHKTPLFIVSPWINKFYILDLRAGKSFVEWAVAQGHTVFITSWANPDANLAQKSFEDYMRDGVLDSLRQIESITGEREVNMVGYCLGGTLMATTLAYIADSEDAGRIKSSTFLTTLLDFEHAGEMKLFLDDEQLKTLDKMMEKSGVLDGREMQRTFSLMRSNDLIWSFVVNNYLLGKEPFPFDLLYWNDDCTNMPAAMHRFYLRNMYRDNKLIEAGGITMGDVPIDLRKIDVPCHFISAREDHIAPWIATYAGTHLPTGDVTFTLAASGHIAGVVNPPEKKKYCYWTNDKHPKEPDAWLENAEQHEGSWWGHWHEWLKPHAGEMVKPRPPAKGIEPAPGRYVMVKY